MVITLRGNALDGQHDFQSGPAAWQAPIPKEARPDCATCPKPDLGHLNAQAVWLHQQIRSQQQRSPMSGEIFGLRFEALMAALEWFTEAGRISDPDAVLDRVRIVDGYYCEAQNRKLEAAQKNA